MDGGDWISGSIIHADGGEDIVSYVGQGGDLIQFIIKLFKEQK